MDNGTTYTPTFILCDKRLPTENGFYLCLIETETEVGMVSYKVPQIVTMYYDRESWYRLNLEDEGYKPCYSVYNEHDIKLPLFEVIGWAKPI